MKSGFVFPGENISKLEAEMEKRKNIAQTQILDQKIAQIMRNSRHHNSRQKGVNSPLEYAKRC